MSLSSFYNQSSHSLDWWHHCLSATHVGSLLWPVLGARRHPWVWLVFHRSLAGELSQVCIPDRMAKVMTDIPVWDTIVIFQPWVIWQHQYRVGHGPALQQYLAIYKMVTFLLLVALKAWLDTEKHSRNGLALCSMCRLAGWLFTTSRQFFVGAVVGVQVHRPLCICVRGPQYCLRSLVCSKVLTHLGAPSCAGLLLIHAGL